MFPKAAWLSSIKAAPVVHPGAPEFCDDKDNDCDGEKEASACKACSSDGDCSKLGTGTTEYYCRRPLGQCKAKGVCMPQPPCPFVWIPVCGCDRKTKSNAQCAANEGISVDYAGICTPPRSAPLSRQMFTSRPAACPVWHEDPAKAAPIAFGSVAEGGDTLDLRIGLSESAAPTDVYLLLHAPELDPHEVYVFHEDGAVRPSAAGVAPWKSSVRSRVDEIVLGAIPAAALPAATYIFGVVSAPAGSLGYYHFWLSALSVSRSGRPAISGLTAPETVCAGESFRVTYTYSDPDGLSDVKEHHVLMSDGYHYSHSAGGSGRFDVGGFFFDSPGNHWVKAYVVDFGGRTSNVLQVSVKVVDCG